MREQPRRERILLEEIESLRDRVAEVGAADRALFEESAVPKSGEDLERIREWICAVRGAMKRMKNSSGDGSWDLRSYFGRG